MRLNPLILFAFLAACSDFPALDNAISPQATRGPFPTLVPLGPILAQAAQLEQSGRVSEQVTAGVQSRVASLRARANGLRGPVIDSATRARMRAGINTAALQ